MPLRTDQVMDFVYNILPYMAVKSRWQPLMREWPIATAHWHFRPDEKLFQQSANVMGHELFMRQSRAVGRLEGYLEKHHPAVPYWIERTFRFVPRQSRGSRYTVFYDAWTGAPMPIMKQVPELLYSLIPYFRW